MDISKLWGLDKNWFWIFPVLWLSVMEMLLHVKLGVIFWLATGWFFMLDWQSRYFLGQQFSESGAFRLLKSVYYAFLVCLIIFGVFLALDAFLRILGYNLPYFRLP